MSENINLFCMMHIIADKIHKNYILQMKKIELINLINTKYKYLCKFNNNNKQLSIGMHML